MPNIEDDNNFDDDCDDFFLSLRTSNTFSTREGPINYNEDDDIDDPDDDYYDDDDENNEDKDDDVS